MDLVDSNGLRIRFAHRSIRFSVPLSGSLRPATVRLRTYMYIDGRIPDGLTLLVAGPLRLLPLPPVRAAVAGPLPDPARGKWQTIAVVVFLVEGCEKQLAAGIPDSLGLPQAWNSE